MIGGSYPCDQNREVWRRLPHFHMDYGRVGELDQDPDLSVFHKLIFLCQLFQRCLRHICRFLCGHSPHQFLAFSRIWHNWRKAGSWEWQSSRTHVQQELCMLNSDEWCLLDMDASCPNPNLSLNLEWREPWLRKIAKLPKRRKTFLSWRKLSTTELTHWNSNPIIKRQN